MTFFVYFSIVCIFFRQKIPNMKRGATLKQFKNAILGNFKLFNITAMLMQETREDNKEKCFLFVRYKK